MAAASPAFPVYLVRGDDPVVVSDAVRALVGELVGEDDPALVVEEVPTGGDDDVTTIVEAAQTPPFFTGRRVVVARDVGRFATQEVAPLVAYLADPLPTTNLVLVAGGGQLARALQDAVRKVGHVVEARVPTGRGRGGWLAERLKAATVHLKPAAVARLDEHLGDDVGRLGSLLDTLAAAYGPGATIDADDLAPFLGEAGSVAPWELTDAIDKGDTALALEHLRRLTGAGGRHPLAVLGTLHTHYSRMLRLDGADVADEKAAAAALGLTGSTFPAKKALSQTRRLGHDRIVRAVTLLGGADVALKGMTDWPGDLVLEVLVARLSRLAPRSTGRPTGRR